jgi:hypothetical protein
MITALTINLADPTLSPVERATLRALVVRNAALLDAREVEKMVVTEHDAKGRIRRFEKEKILELPSLWIRLDLTAKGYFAHELEVLNQLAERLYDEPDVEVVVTEEASPMPTPPKHKGNGRWP